MSVNNKSRKKSAARKRRLLVFIFVILLLFTLLVGAGAALMPREERIANGISVAQIDLSRKTIQQATEQLAGMFSRIVDAPLTLRAGNHQMVTSMRQLGITPDINATLSQAYAIGRTGALPTRIFSSAKLRWQKMSIKPVYQINEAVAMSELTALAKLADRAPKNAGVIWRDNKVEVSADEAGMTLDVAEALQLIHRELLARISSGNMAADEISLPYHEKQARITAEALHEVDTELSKFSTSFASSSSNRARNIEIATLAMNQRILMPGERFSFNETVGERTAARGYRIAPVIVNGQMDSGLGGGVCQVSTTLYNAVLLANLAIVERRHHSHPSTYVPSGLDATVSFGSIDFKFANNMKTPVVLITSADNRTLMVRVMGKGPAPQVKMLRSGITSLPGKSITRNDPSLPAGTRKVQKGSGGLAVTVSREVAGVATVISRDRYTGTPAIIRVGSGPAKVKPPIDTIPPPTEADPPTQPVTDQPGANTVLPDTRSTPATRNHGR